MYTDNILEHATHPRNYGSIPNCDSTKITNPVCGDELELYIEFSEKGTITNIKFSGVCCALATASASLTTDYVLGKNINDIKKIEPFTLYELLGVTVSPMRATCCTLVLDGLNNAIKDK